MAVSKSPALGAAVGLVLAGCGGEQADSSSAASGSEIPDIPAGVIAQSQTIEEEVAAEGGEKTVGPWRIAYIVEPAEGWFETVGGRQRYRSPAAGETHHLEILPIEAKTGRVVPGVPVTLEVVDAAGEVVQEQRLSPYYAEFFHYADNFSIPDAGEYTLRATIAPPRLRRHGEEADGPALADGATVEFEKVSLDPAA